MWCTKGQVVDRALFPVGIQTRHLIAKTCTPSVRWAMCGCGGSQLFTVVSIFLLYNGWSCGGSDDGGICEIPSKSQAILRKRKRKRSDSVLWQKPLHQQKCQKGKVTTQTTPQKSSIKQRLRTDLGRSVGVTKATQLVWLTGLRAHLPTNRNSRLIKRTHV